jgi:hypothetical protein
MEKLFDVDRHCDIVAAHRHETRSLVTTVSFATEIE